MTEQNSDTPTSENTPRTQSSGKGQDNSRVRGIAGRDSRGRGKVRGDRHNQQPNKSNYNNNRLF